MTGLDWTIQNKHIQRKSHLLSTIGIQIFITITFSFFRASLYCLRFQPYTE